MTKYLPPYDQLCAMLGVDKNELQRPGQVLVASDVLLALIRAAVAGLTIDPQAYRKYNPDVDKAFKNLSDALVEKHFKETGYFEGRKFPTLVDVEYYRKRYPDLAAAAATGKLTDPKTHFHEVGASEARVPSAEAHEEMQAWTRLLRTRGGGQSRVTPQR